MKFTTTGSLALAAALLLFGGCTTSHPDAKAAAKFNAVEPAAPEVVAADRLFQQSRYTDAIVACIAIARKDPLTPGLSDLQTRIMTKMSQVRRANIEAQQAASADAAAVDALRQGITPDTYRLNRHVVGETAPLRTPPNKMQTALRKPVSVHLENVNLTDVVAQIGASQNINFVTDSTVGGAKTITIHAENTPLDEILEYIGRNLGVTFSVGQNIIWATAGNDQQGSLPMETRVYRLRKGLPGDEVPGGGDLASLATADSSGGAGNPSAGNGGNSEAGAKKRNNGGKAGNAQAGGGKAQDAAGSISIIADIIRFVPQPQGADITFDNRAHAILVKNTRENLGLTEEIINALDVRPIQVLIEARFIETTASDTRQLGIDWLLGGPTANGSAAKLTVPNTAAGFPAAGTTATGPDIATASGLTAKGKSIGVGDLQSGAGTFLYQGFLDNVGMTAVLQAMQQAQDARTLTVPRITTVNNKTATIHIGEDFQYYDNLTSTTVNQYNNGYSNPGTVSNAVPQFSGTPTTLKLGYKLAVTPSVGADLSTINLALVPDITELLDKADWENAQNPSSATTQAPGKLPIVLQKTIETEVVVRSGETVVLGGLAQASSGKTTTGLPWLEDLPLIGQLFRTDSKNQGTDNLLVFVTATILSDVGEELIPLNPREMPGLPLPAPTTPATRPR